MATTKVTADRNLLGKMAHATQDHLQCYQLRGHCTEPESVTAQHPRGTVRVLLQLTEGIT